MLNAGPEYSEPFRAEVCNSLGAVPAHHSPRDRLTLLSVEGKLGACDKYNEQ